MPKIALTHDRPLLEQLAEQGAMLSHECSTEFNERHRDSSEVSVDLAAAPEPTIVFHGQEIQYRPQFLGSHSASDGTFMWGWNNINGYPDGAVEVANNVRSFGQQAGVEEFVTPVMEVDGDVDIYRRLFAVVRITGTPTFYRMRTEHGYVYFLLYGFEMLPPRVIRVEQSIMGAISGGWVVDHVAALESYLEMRPGLLARGTADGLSIRCSDGELGITLDEHRRVAKTRFTVDEDNVADLHTGR